MLELVAAPVCVAAESTDTYRRLIRISAALQAEVLTPDLTAHQTCVRADRMAAAAQSLIDGESARIAARHGSEPRPHVAASRLLHHYLWSACLLISGPWYLTGRVPRLQDTDLWIDPTSGDLALRPGEWAPGDEAALRTAVAELVGPALDAFQPYVKRGPRALWGMAADDLLSGIWYLGRILGEEDRAIRLATAVLPGDTPPFPGAADFRRLPGTGDRTHWTRTRFGCCLYYAIKPADACLTCPRTTDEERVLRLEA